MEAPSEIAKAEMSIIWAALLTNRRVPIEGTRRTKPALTRAQKRGVGDFLEAKTAVLDISAGEKADLIEAIRDLTGPSSRKRGR